MEAIAILLVGLALCIELTSLRRSMENSAQRIVDALRRKGGSDG